MSNSAPQKTPAPKDWHKADIKAALEKRGLSLSRLSRQHNFSRAACALALAIPWARMERVIADALGVEPQVIWPSRYQDGAPKRSRENTQRAKSIRATQRSVRARKAA